MKMLFFSQIDIGFVIPIIYKRMLKELFYDFYNKLIINNFSIFVFDNSVRFTSSQTNAGAIVKTAPSHRTPSQYLVLGKR